MKSLLGRLRTLVGRKRATPPASPDFLVAQDVAFLPASAFRIETCPLCRDRPTGHVSIYPATPGSRMRASIVWWCDACGSGVVPDAGALLSDYYAITYAAEIKQDRVMEPETYFSPEARRVSNAIDRYLRRVDHQIAALKRLGGPYDAVLDFGSGPGYFLKMLDPPLKYAVEPDAASEKFLSHIGAKRVRLDAVPPGSLDLVVASHSIEHLLIEDLDATLASMLAALKPGGLLYVEVPQAALTALELPYRHEPHSIFFSPRGLDRTVRRAGFEIVERGYRSPGAVTFRRDAIWAPDPSDPFEAGIGGGMTIVGRRPNGADRT